MTLLDDLFALYNKVWTDTTYNETKDGYIAMSYEDFEEIMALCEQIQEPK